MSAARSTASAVFDQGANSWYFVAADYAFGRAMVRDATSVVNEKGDKVLGAVWHPLGTSDFASYLLQAQGSGAKVVAFVSGGSDFINALKQSNEFGLAAGGQKIVSMQTFISDIHAIGLSIAQNLTLTAAFYWDLDDQTRAWSKRFGRSQRRKDAYHGSSRSLQCGSTLSQGRCQSSNYGRGGGGGSDARDAG